MWSSSMIIRYWELWHTNSSDGLSQRSRPGCRACKPLLLYETYCHNLVRGKHKGHWLPFWRTREIFSSPCLKGVSAVIKAQRDLNGGKLILHSIIMCLHLPCSSAVLLHLLLTTTNSPLSLMFYSRLYSQQFDGSFFCLPAPPVFIH